MTAPAHPPRSPSGVRSFNAALLAELKRLRPLVFEKTNCVEFMPGKTATDADWAASKIARAQDLHSLYARIGQLQEDEADREPLAALCVSGGGIRSATFNLGVLQGLAERGVLKRFDYLSSVSGGGYIAGWLNAWVHREGREKVLGALAQSAADRHADPLAPEPKPLDHLREFSNYLTPTVGFFTADSWMLVATVMRNILLNWLVILPLLVAVIWIPLMLPRVLSLEPPPGLPAEIFGLSLAFGVFASFFAHRYRRSPYRQDLKQSTVVGLAVVPLYIAALLLAWAGFYLPWDSWCCTNLSPNLLKALCAGAWSFLVPLAGWWLSGWSKGGADPASPRRLGWPLADLLGLVVAGLIAGALLIALAQWPLLAHWPHPPENDTSSYLFVVLALPALLGVYTASRGISAAVTSLSALRPPGTGRELAEHDLEWWARYSGWVLLFAVGWAAVSALCLYGPLALRALPDWGKMMIAAAGGASGLIVRVLGAGVHTTSGRGAGTEQASPLREWALALAAPFFAGLLIAFAALGVNNLVLWVKHEVEISRLGAPGVGVGMHFAGMLVALALPVIVFTIAAVLLGRIVNTNKFSLHGMYRNRLVRAYLGASNAARKPDPFTGFARDDDLPLHELRAYAGGEEATRPMPVINVALNLVTTGDKLAWQQRKAESFSMTPLYCGNFHEGYRDTAEYGGREGITLGTAMAISGAAANPNMGYHSSSAITFLLTLFNARLGAWLGNTNWHGDDTYRRSGPRSSVGPLLAELLGLTNERGPFVDLSDGGHFENLGLYEMVLRRCRTIVVCDAGADSLATFGDLGNAIRKIRIDFGIPIEFPNGIQVRGRDDGKAGLYWASGVIRYQDADGDTVSNGDLLYIKPAYYGREKPPPYDVFSYAESAHSFPHEPTSDQWFDESQFESYRALGRHIVDEMLGGGQRRSVAEVVKMATEETLAAAP